MSLGSITDFDGLRFVVARYSEDVTWVPGLLKRFPGADCTIYNKGPTEVPCDDSYDIIELVNVGRESETYLRHIIRGYDSADRDEITVFLQGHPFDHCFGEPLFDRVHGCVLNIMKGSSFENVGTRLIRISDGVPRFHMTIREELKQTSMDLFGKGLPERFEFSAGALFAVSRSIVESRPVEFYQKALGMLVDDVNPVRGFCFERLWSLIFTLE